LYDLDNDGTLSKGEFKYFLKANLQYLNSEGELRDLLDSKQPLSDQPPSFT
jgi:Ca2+-binding EF-hand superfamily protein